MLTTYVRSSSLNTHTMCPFQFYLTYVLGFNWPAGKSACMGNVMHKALELLANKGIAKRAGKDGYEDEIFGWLKIEEINHKWATEKAFAYYHDLEPFHKWSRYDLPTCIEWVNKYKTESGGIYDPEFMNVLEAEKKFDFEIKKPEFKYEYQLEDGTVLDGYLSVKGTVDLVTMNPNRVLEIVDHKSGARKDWNTEEVKSFKKLTQDAQLKLYFYAAANIFPEVDTFLMTIIFINDGGAYSIPFYRSTDLESAEQMLLDKFNEIKNTKKPRLKKSWKCSKLCGQGKNNYGDSGKTVCQFFEPLVARDGTDKVFAEFGDVKKLTSYGSGGGRASTIKE